MQINAMSKLHATIREQEFSSYANLTARQWLKVLYFQPNLESCAPLGQEGFRQDSTLVSSLWSRLVARHPQFAKYCPWQSLRREDWVRILSRQPQFYEHYIHDCPNKRNWLYALGGGQKAQIVCAQPQLVEHFDTSDLNDSDWSLILKRHPQLHSKCTLAKLAPTVLGKILRSQPQLVDAFYVNDLSPYAVLQVADTYPKILDHYDITRFAEISHSDSPWIEKYPCLVQFCDWCFSERYWARLLDNLAFWHNTGHRPKLSSKDFLEKPAYSDDVFLQNDNGLEPEPEGRVMPAANDPTCRLGLDSILDECHCCLEPLENSRRMPQHIKDIFNDVDFSLDMLVDKMTMMNSEECGYMLRAMVSTGRFQFFSDSLAAFKNTLNDSEPQYLLPIILLFANPYTIYLMLRHIEFGGQQGAIAKFVDDGGNNALHYFFIRAPWRLDPIKKEIIRFLVKCGVEPDQPNAKGFSFRQLRRKLKMYLR